MLYNTSNDLKHCSDILMMIVHCFLYLIMLMLRSSSSFRGSFQTHNCQLAYQRKLLSILLSKSNSNWLNEIKTVTSSSNDKLSMLKSLYVKKNRDKLNLILLEGHRQIIDAFQRNFIPKIVLLTQDAALTSKLSEELLNQLHKLYKIDQDRIKFVDHKLIAGISETVTSQGVIAAFERPTSESIENLFQNIMTEDTVSGKNQLVLITDTISDPGNLGTLIRTCYGFGVTRMIICGGVDVWSPKVVRSSMGACLSFPVIESNWKSIYESLSVYKGQFGTRVKLQLALAESTELSIPYDKYDFIPSTIVVIGSEAQGIDNNARKISSIIPTTSIEIPMSNSLESLNAAIAGAVILGEAARQRRYSNK